MRTRVFAYECFRHLLLYWAVVLSMLLWGIALAAAFWLPGAGDGAVGAGRESRAMFLLALQGVLAVGVLWGVSEAAFDLLHPAIATFFLSKPLGRRTYAAVVFGCSHAVVVTALVAMAASGAAVLFASGVPLSVVHAKVFAARMMLANGAVAVALALSVSMRVKGIAVMAGSALMVLGTPGLFLPVGTTGETVQGATWFGLVSGITIAGTVIAWIVFQHRDMT